jgi:hypothetical protein
LYGWQERHIAKETADETRASVPKTGDSREVKSTVNNRQEIAKYARIKRLPTTLPNAKAEDDPSTAIREEILDTSSTTKTKPETFGAEQTQAKHPRWPHPNKDGLSTEKEPQDARININVDSGEPSKPALEPRGKDEHIAKSQHANLKVAIDENFNAGAQELTRLEPVTKNPIRMTSQPPWLALRPELPPIFARQLQPKPTTFNYCDYEKLQALTDRPEEHLYNLPEIPYVDDNSVEVDDGAYAGQILTHTYGEQAIGEHGNYVEDNGSWQSEMYPLHENTMNNEYYNKQVPGVHDGDSVQGFSYDNVETCSPLEEHYDNILYDIEEEDEQLEGFWRPHLQYR